MKRLLALCLALMLPLSALAQTTLVSQPDRRLVKAGTLTPAALPIPGESPTTGLPWEGYYMPMLVQIDNTMGGVGENIQPWGVRFADIVYETPLHQNGATRISFLFSDYIPDRVGPVRSARVGHVWLWYEWRGGFLFYGGQEAEGSNIYEEFSKLGYAYYKGAPLFSGVVSEGKYWKKYYGRVEGLTAPHNVTANAAAMQALIPAEHEPLMRPFLFRDDPPQGDAALQVQVGWKNPHYACDFRYDENAGAYYRSVAGKPYVDKETQDPISFANVIVQRTKLRFNNNVANPVTSNVGSGNCDIFMGGRYIPGYWVRASMAEPTVYFDDKGQPLRLLRGPSYIALADDSIPVTYE